VPAAEARDIDIAEEQTQESSADGRAKESKGEEGQRGQGDNEKETRGMWRENNKTQVCSKCNKLHENII
jgi:hypothetical protein